MIQKPKQKPKPIVFQGTGYRIIRSDPRNLELRVLGQNKDGKEDYQFKGYFGTVEKALAHLIYDSSLLDETITHDFKSYLQSIVDAKNTVVTDIKNQLALTPEEKSEIGPDVSSYDEIDDDEFF